ncbi:MAG TPA: bacteriocin fulvocin C-related protein [Flavitalea sp.]|nr:bacteriocin fulvocin C-related protein [Flavitalea sp.]
MKKWMLYLAILYVLTGCKKEEAPSAVPKVDHLASLLASEIPAQKVMFNLLKDEDKFQVWQDHLTKKQRELQPGSSQWKLIDELKRFNSSAFYKYGSDSKEIATTYFASAWIKRAEQAFSSEQLYQVAYNLNPPQKVEAFYGRMMGQRGTQLNQLNPGSPYNNEAYADCFCAVGSGYTCPYSTYVYTNRGYIMERHYATCYYNGSKPCDVEGGCGFVGWSLCDGNVCA